MFVQSNRFTLVFLRVTDGFAHQPQIEWIEVVGIADVMSSLYGSSILKAVW
jgi:hypothetical protein